VSYIAADRRHASGARIYIDLISRVRKLLFKSTTGGGQPDAVDVHKPDAAKTRARPPCKRRTNGSFRAAITANTRQYICLLRTLVDIYPSSHHRDGHLHPSTPNPNINSVTNNPERRILTASVNHNPNNFNRDPKQQVSTVGK